MSESVTFLGIGGHLQRNTHPYHSWERGLNENTNGLIRQYLSKGTDFNKLTDRQVLEIMDKLNNRPRKCLGSL